jgi:adenosine kinase
MRIALSGSIATDQLMTFPGRFTEQLLPEELSHLSVAFLVDDMALRRGGVAGNIAYGMSRLGQHPVLVGAVGADAGDYVADLATGGVDVSGVHTSAERHTARFVCTTDRDLNQIAAFYPGAMAEAGTIRLSDLAPLDLVVVSPNDPAAMSAHTSQARSAGIPVVADPSQQIASLGGEVLRDLVDGAEALVSNGYEARLLEHKTGWSATDIAERVHIRITTRGGDGVLAETRDGEVLEVPVVPTEAPVDPTGVGDAFRAGWLSAHAAGHPLLRCLQLGTLLATLCLEAVGPQGWDLATPDEADVALQRLAQAHGEDAASDVKTLLTRPTSTRT